MRAAQPDDGFVGEELGGHEGGDRIWLVDPLCGTLNFAAQTPLAAVNVALSVGGEVTAAAVVDPLAHETFWTDGGAAWLRRGTVDSALRSSADSRLVDVNLDGMPADAAFRAVDVLADPAFADRFGSRVLSTTLATAWVAAGRRAAYLTADDLRGSVHFASAIALCRAAGCVVTGVHGQSFDEGPNGLVVAADPADHAALLEMVMRAHR